MQKYLTPILVVSVSLLVAGTVTSNYVEQYSIDQSKIPEKVEESEGFQKWITNLRNKGLGTTADEFRLVEDNEIFNTKWMKVYSADDQEQVDQFYDYAQRYREFDDVEFSPNEKQFVDFRSELRGDKVIGEYNPNEVHYYGIRDDKILNARFVDCSLDANCYFDRAFFLDNTNDVYVATEFSRNFNEKLPEDQIEPCARNEECTYTIKLHLIDLINNKRWVYESKPFDLNLEEMIPEL